MNRELLSKAKTEMIVGTYNYGKDDGEWVKGYLYCDTGKYMIRQFEVERADYVSYEINPETICPNTGVTDKNGKQIWKNDIVDFMGHKGRISFECGCFGIAFSDCIDWEEIENNIYPVTGCDNPLRACENDNFISLWEVMWNFNDEEDSINTIEVIGNTFDDLELLENKTNIEEMD